MSASQCCEKAGTCFPVRELYVRRRLELVFHALCIRVLYLLIQKVGVCCGYIIYVQIYV